MDSSVSLVVTGLLLGVRHGIDWDHIAAITDITSTTASGVRNGRTQQAELAHSGHARVGGGSLATSFGRAEAVAAGARTVVADGPPLLLTLGAEQRHALALGTLYALGHGLVVAILGLLALSFGAILPAWVDPLMSRVVGFTLLLLGAWVFYSLYAYFRHGIDFQLRSRWMVLFAVVRGGWARLRAGFRGTQRQAPAAEVGAYGPRAAFAVGMIHGIGAETGSQVLIIAAIGGASSLGLGVPMMLAFIIGMLISNSLIAVVTATGFIASQLRRRIYLVAGGIAGAFSLLVGLLFLFDLEGSLPDLDSVLRLAGMGS